MTELKFGTGGLRAIMGEGANRMNIDTVRAATRGVARWMQTHEPPQRAVIAWDSRNNSELFARKTAETLAEHGINALLFPRLVPTPTLSFAVRYLNCATGIMITASHNPAEYNGYKVYGPDGGQITDAAAGEIQAYIGDRRTHANNAPLRRGDIKTLSHEVEQAYYDSVMSLRLETDTAPLSIVYSPLNGTGLVPVTTVLRRTGFDDVTVVPSQERPDGEFPTCPRPNPEEPETLTEGIRLLTEKGADILFATDPDCDRVGVAVNTKKGVRILNGNEIGVLLLDYVCRRRIEQGLMPERPLAIKTIVTTELSAKIADNYNVELRNVLTGFKYIGEQIGALEAIGEPERFIFGFEESCGYLSGTHARDKDAVNACMLICDMAARYKSCGLTLCGALDAIYKKHGYYASRLTSLTFDGEADKMLSAMSRLRKSPTGSIGGYSVVSVTDYLSDTGLPKSDVLQFRLDGEAMITVRPSGTEPKVKVYCEASGVSSAEASYKAERCGDAVRRFFAAEGEIF